MNMSDSFNHWESFWYQSEPLEVPFSQNQFLGWDFFCHFLQQTGSSEILTLQQYEDILRGTRLQAFHHKILQRRLLANFWLLLLRSLCNAANKHNLPGPVPRSKTRWNLDLKFEIFLVSSPYYWGSVVYDQWLFCPLFLQKSAKWPNYIKKGSQKKTTVIVLNPKRKDLRLWIFCLELVICFHKVKTGRNIGAQQISP